MTRVFLTVNLDRTYIKLVNLPSFGELAYLFDNIPNMWTHSIEGDMLARFKQLNFNPDLDFFAVSGIVPLSHIALAVLVEEYGAIKTLLFDSRERIYREKEVGGLIV